MATECKEFHPYPYQRFCIQHIIDHPVAGLFVDMGMGKTVMTLTAFNYLKYYAWQIQRCLVIAPKKVAEATWRTRNFRVAAFAPSALLRGAGNSYTTPRRDGC